MPRDLESLSRDIHQTLDIPMKEAELYLETLRQGICVPRDPATRDRARSLAARGVLILGARGESYLPLHPRLALSNLFRVYEETVTRQRKERRLRVDRLTLELIPLMPGESKGTNPAPPRGARTAKG